jgi:HlyD family secretion protein
MDLKVGQQIAAGLPVAQLADTSRWLVETTDLTELNVVDVQVADRVSVSVDALPDAMLVGSVQSIKPLGENILGDITYKVTVALEDSDPRLRWNMTAAATIEP